MLYRFCAALTHRTENGVEENWCAIDASDRHTPLQGASAAQR